LYPFSPIVGIVVSKTCPCRSAAAFIRRVPNKLAISIMASTSSVELKNGNRRPSNVRRMTPADQMSILVVWDVHLNKTSGARNPLVPARFARRDGRGSFLGYPVGGVDERVH